MFNLCCSVTCSVLLLLLKYFVFCVISLSGAFNVPYCVVRLCADRCLWVAYKYWSLVSDTVISRGDFLVLDGVYSLMFFVFILRKIIFAGLI